MSVAAGCLSASRGGAGMCLASPVAPLHFRNHVKSESWLCYKFKERSSRRRDKKIVRTPRKISLQRVRRNLYLLTANQSNTRIPSTTARITVDGRSWEELIARVLLPEASTLTGIPKGFIETVCAHSVHSREGGRVVHLQGTGDKTLCELTTTIGMSDAGIGLAE